MHSSQTKRRVALSSAVLLLGGVLAACGGGGGSDDDEALSVAVTSGADPGDIIAVTAPIEFGDQFDLSMKESDIQRFDSHATAAQVMLSGRTNAIAGSFAGNLALIAKKPSVRIFCPMQIATTEMVIGTGKTDSLESLKSEDTVLAIDSPGGAADSFLNALLQVKDAGFTVADIPNKKILEDGGQRVTAVQTGEATASIVDSTEFATLEKALGKGKIHVISVLARDLGESAIYQVFAAEKKWLDDNSDLAARWCAAVVTASRAAAEDYDELERIVNEYVEPNPPKAELEAMFELSEEHTIWPTEPVLTEEQYDANMKAALVSGVIKEEIPYEDAVDLDIMNKAADLLEDGDE